MINRTKKVTWEDINVKIAIAYLLVLIAGLLLYIAFIK
jgi:hypothetical protein